MRAVERDGFAILPQLLSRSEVEGLTDAITAAGRSGTYAIRNLLSSVPAVSELATSGPLMTLAQSVLGRGAQPVKGTLFDKTADANWLVPWHQNLTVCINRRVDVEGYGPWTIKAGVHNVQPPVPILQQMLAVRIHLDECGEHNGALRVIPGTHKAGRLSAEQIASAQAQMESVTCCVPSGGAVLMRPLLLHASSAANNPTHRRVIHIDYANAELAPGLSWFTALCD